MSGDQVPGKKALTKSTPKDAQKVHKVQQTKDMYEQCTNHPGKNLDYYCESHDEIGCNVCVALGRHKDCEVGHIPELSKRTNNANEYNELFEEIEDLQEQYEDTKVISKASITEVEARSKAYTEKVTQLGERVIEHVRNLMQIAVDEKDEFVKERLDEIRDLQEQNEKIMEETIHMRANLKAKKNSGYQIFVPMKKLQSRVTNAKEILRKTQIYSKPTVFQFDENPDIEIDSLGTFYKYMKVMEQYEDINISLEDNEDTPSIRNLKLLSDGRLAMVDRNNESVKVVDTEDETVSEIKMEHEPWDLAEVNKGQLAVTLPDVGMIQFLSLADGLSLGPVIETDDYCHGIASCDNKLIVSYASYEKSEIQILDMEGNVLSKINTSPNGEKLFCYPRYVAVYPENDMVYVSDEETVTCMTLAGEVKAVFSEDKTFGLAQGENGSVYICGKGSIHHITAEGTKIQTLLDPGLEGADSWCIAYDVDNHMIYLGGDSESLKVYQLQ